jgi:superfamily II DNA or RNA helicase
MAINLFGKAAVFADDPESEGEDDAAHLEIPNHAFDVVIADECHRGYTSAELSLWRNTIDHFDAIKIGLTATPAAHSKAYFKDVVYRYDYDAAVTDGYLVDYDVLTIKSDIRMNGVFLKEGEEVGVIDTKSGAQTLDLLEDEREYDTSEIEQKVTAMHATTATGTPAWAARIRAGEAILSSVGRIFTSAVSAGEPTSPSSAVIIVRPNPDADAEISDSGFSNGRGQPHRQ